MRKHPEPPDLFRAKQNEPRVSLTFFARLTALLLCLTAAMPDSSLAEPIIMLFRDKPPYSYVEKGVQKGFLLERTQKILSHAQIDVKFAISTPKRIFQDLQNNAAAVCSFGWYKIPEREKYARFSASIHQDMPHIVLTNQKSVQALRRHRTLKSMMTDPSLVLAVVDGTSYGPELDAMIAAFPGKVDRALLPPTQVAKKISGNRADLMFIDHDDYDYLMKSNAEFRNSGMVVVKYPDTPDGLKRYILCSKKVSEYVMRKINAAIKTESAR